MATKWTASTARRIQQPSAKGHNKASHLQPRYRQCRGSAPIDHSRQNATTNTSGTNYAHLQNRPKHEKFKFSSFIVHFFSSSPLTFFDCRCLRYANVCSHSPLQNSLTTFSSLILGIKLIPQWLQPRGTKSFDGRRCTFLCALALFRARTTVGAGVLVDSIATDSIGIHLLRARVVSVVVV